MLPLTCMQLTYNIVVEIIGAPRNVKSRSKISVQRHCEKDRNKYVHNEMTLLKIVQHHGGKGVNACATKSYCKLIVQHKYCE